MVLLSSLVWMRPLAAGTWPREPTSAPDEAAHYVTGLMIRAYVDEGLGHSPRTFAEQYDSLFGPDVTVLGVSTDSLTTHVRFATSLNLPFRLLSDPSQQVARRYAAGDESGYLRRVVYVIGPDGKVRYRNLRFNALDPKHYAELGAAVRRTRSG